MYNSKWQSGQKHFQVWVYDPDSASRTHESWRVGFYVRQQVSSGTVGPRPPATSTQTGSKWQSFNWAQDSAAFAQAVEIEGVGYLAGSQDK
jgi:hypothetical protein